MFASSLLLRVLLLAACVLFLWALFANDTGAAGPERHYRVKPGDSLWSIAVAHVPGDPREGAWELERRNGLSSPMIEPGQVLVLP